MPLVNAILVLIMVAVAPWLIDRFFPTASSIKTILNVVVIVGVVVWLLQASGLWGGVSSIRLGS